MEMVQCETCHKFLIKIEKKNELAQIRLPVTVKWMEKNSISIMGWLGTFSKSCLGVMVNPK